MHTLPDPLLVALSGVRVTAVSAILVTDITEKSQHTQRKSEAIVNLGSHS